MDDLTNNIPTQKEAQIPETVVWPTNTDGTKKKQKRRILYLVLAILLTVSSALGSFYLSRNLNQASTPNAPESQPAAAGKNQVTENTKAQGCQQGCASDEYCENTRCRKTGGKADGRTEWEQYVQSIPTATPTLAGATYICTSQNCPGPEFHCASANRCESSAGFCNGLRCSGRCVRDGANNYRCDTSPTTGGTLDSSNDPNNCGAIDTKCAVGVQKCENGVCIAAVSGAGLCDGIVPDRTIENYTRGGVKGVDTGYTKTCCVPGGVGVDPNTNKVDERVHWTNCAAGTTCRQGVGCIGSPTKTPDKTTNEVTTTTTINPTKNPTVTVSPTITTTVTVSPTTTITTTVTVTPTIVGCNESCTADTDCSAGLFCDSTSNKCRKAECSTATSCVCPTATPTDEPTPEPTIVDCNYKCNSDDNCSSGLICDSDSGRCRRAACSDEKDCSCPKPRKTDAPTREVTRYVARTTVQPTVLKEAGILDFPGAAVFGSGLLLTVIGILLAL